MELAYERRGSGEPLVLIHGIGHRHQAWQPVLDLLAEHHDVIAIDIPGFGESPPITLKAGERHTIDVVVRAIVEALTELGIERPHVAGNSLGGALSLELARNGHVATATALSPAGFWKPWEIRWGLTVLSVTRAMSFAPKPLLRQFATRPALRSAANGLIFNRPRNIDPEYAYGDTIALRNGKSFRPIAREAHHYFYSGEPSVPTTVAWGTHDKILLRRQFGRAKAILPKARHVDLPGCGHVPMWDDPQLVARVILETTGAIPSTV
jgi:pimeloyl-ACP methyl ester carboxylesterase